jgi:hypothetical protein
MAGKTLVRVFLAEQVNGGVLQAVIAPDTRNDVC